jgi:hypothetical protein
MVDVIVGYLLGLLHGMRHALEPDHVAAVSTVIAEQRSARASVRFALAWGAGHGLTLLVVGGLLFAFRQEMPAGLSDAFELAVAVMLVGLGVRALFLAARAATVGPLAPHRHGDLEHVHPEAAEHIHVRGWALARRPLAIGLMHGLAGSGALAAMVMARLPTAGAGLAFMALYGVGAMCGMAALAGVAGVPLARLVRLPNVPAALMAATGAFSMALGGFWGWPLVGRFFGQP